MRSAVLNTANLGWFSSDRTIAEYAEEIWKVKPAT
jgi:starch phosphorylase